MERPETTLFLLASVDGKISTGDTDIMDVDKDFPQISGVKEGLYQYYDIEKTTDLFSFNTGRVFAKIGINEKTDEPEKTPITFVVVDNKPHLTERGVAYLAKKSKQLIIATTDKLHPAFAQRKVHQNVEIVLYDAHIDFKNLFEKLKKEYGAERITVQSGGMLNATLIRSGLIDRVLLVIAPAFIGGKDTPTVMDGESLHAPNELFNIKALELVRAEPLKNSYVLLEYTVKNI